ncbi:MAG: putative ABC exporter domain-containing protein [Muricomes sp.]
MDNHYKATGAKAIFYRQFLEYKKEKYFIFSKMTAFCLAIVLILSQAMKKGILESGNPQFFLLGIIAYITLILTGYLGKWEAELKSPYLFMIPDSPVKKLWYSTLMEHIKALIDGCIFCIPLGIIWKINPVQVVLGILIYTVLQANRMYTRVVAQCLLGDTLGKTGQDIVRVCIQMTLLGLGVAAAVLVGVIVNVDFVFPIVLIYSIIITIIVALIASVRFQSMEQLG